jgi:hypothetical protein
MLTATPPVVHVVISGGTDWPTIVAAVATGVVGIAGIIGTAWQGKRSRDMGRNTLRREAYAAFILALDHLERTWNAPETLEAEYVSQKMGEVTAQAVREIQQKYVNIQLIGSDKAKQKAQEVRLAAWALSDYLHGGSREDTLKSDLGKLFDNFTKTARSFVETAETESQG